MSREEYLALTVKALRERAAALAIAGRARLKKEELVEAILAAEALAAEALAAEAPVALSSAPEAEAPVTPEALPEPAAIGTEEPGAGGEEPAQASPEAALEVLVETGVQAAAEAAVDLPLEETVELLTEDLAVEPAVASAAVIAEPTEPSAPPFIDRGPRLPERPVSTPRALVRDPETVFVYWDGPGSSLPDAPPVAAVAATTAAGQVAHRFETTGADGYVRAPVAEIAEITVQPAGGEAVSLSLPAPAPPPAAAPRPRPQRATAVAEETAWREATAGLFSPPPTPYPLSR